MWVFLVAQLQNDTSTEYCILKSVLQVLFYSRVHNSLLCGLFLRYNVLRMVLIEVTHGSVDIMLPAASNYCPDAIITYF